jgi:(1->4)-alpha-D-glucan 1-alpha-D-glucosylmutase
VRARLNVLTEISAEWEKLLFRWRRLNRDKKQQVAGMPVPTPSEEVLIYQSLLGAWPLAPEDDPGFLERFPGFVIKATREAKTYSGWIRQGEAHEAAMLHFAAAILEDTPENRFRQEFLRVQERLAWYGALNSLSQVLIKITSPGIPDFYQGAELWNLTLVDPDNRRPVDFRQRIALLESIRKDQTESFPQLLNDIVTNWKDGRIKLHLTDKALSYRREHASVFRCGDYVPLTAQGPRENHVCAFARRENGFWCLTVTPRWTTRLAAAGKPPLGKTVWRDTGLTLPEAAPERWRNILTGERLRTLPVAEGQRALPLRSVFRRFPVALLQGL